MTGKNTYRTIFYFFSSNSSGYYLYMEAASCHRSSSIFFYIPNNDVVTPRFSRCMLIGSRSQPLTELFYILDTRQSAR